MDCIFCKISKKLLGSKTLYEDDKVIAIMDINPVCDGHVLIIPKEHYETVFQVPDEVLCHMFNIGKQICKKLMTKLNETGLTFSINYGTKQEVKHLHLHLMPDYEKMPTKTYEEIYQILMD